MEYKRSLKIGVDDYTENEVVLDVVGDVNITGIANAAKFVGDITTNSLSIVDNDSGSDYSGDIVSQQKSYTAITETLTPTSIHKFLSVDDYGTVEYLIQATSGLSFHTVKLVSINNSISINNLEVSSVFLGSTLASYNVTIEDDFINLVVTPTTTDKIVYSIIYTAIKKPYKQYIIRDENNNTIVTEDDKSIQVQF